MARRVTVFGGSGFIGRHLVKRLAAAGWVVRVAVRDPEAAAFLTTAGEVGQVVPVFADIANAESAAVALAGSEAVVNLVGILVGRGRRSFHAIHVEGAANVARAAAAAGVQRLIHISALGADTSSASLYFRSKAEGEAAVMAAFPLATILRPAVVFGPEDDFFNRFARLARVSPVLPVVGPGPTYDRATRRLDPYGGGGCRFQPVYVGDVAEAIMACLADPASVGQVYELAGPRVYTMRQIMELVLSVTGRRRMLVPLPFWLARIQAFFLQFWPTPPLTPDQVTMMRTDTVFTGAKPGLSALGVTPTAAEVMLPSYLERYRSQQARTLTRQPPR